MICSAVHTKSCSDVQTNIYSDVHKVTHVQIVRLSALPLSATMGVATTKAGIAAVGSW